MRVVCYLGAPKVSVPWVERSLGDGKEWRQHFRIPGEKQVEEEGLFTVASCMCSSTAEPAEFQGYQSGYKMISGLQM